jgi:hypothetical protein
MERGYPNPSGTVIGFNFSSQLGMGKVMSKYMRIGYGDGKCKICPHPAPLPCLDVMQGMSNVEAKPNKCNCAEVMQGMWDKKKDKWKLKLVQDKKKVEWLKFFVIVS